MNAVIFLLGMYKNDSKLSCLLIYAISFPEYPQINKLAKIDPTLVPADFMHVKPFSSSAQIAPIYASPFMPPP